MKEKTTVKITQHEQRPVEKQVLAEAIISMSDGVKRLKKTGINFEAIVLLTQSHCNGVGQRLHKKKPSIAEVRCVLESLEDLGRTYTT